MRNTDVKQRYRTKEAKELADRIKAACPDATIGLTAGGHLKVTGPLGTTFLPSSQRNDAGLPARLKNKLARKSGIEI